MRYSNKQCSSSYSVFGSRRNCSSGGAERRDSCLQALTEDISTPADVAPSALETIIFDCCMGCISAQTYCLLLAGRYAELPGDLRGVRVHLPCSAVPRTNTRPRLHRRTIHCHLLSLPGTTRACLPAENFSTASTPWLGSRVVSVLDAGAERPGFDSQP